MEWWATRALPALSCRPQPSQSPGFFALPGCAQAHPEPQRSAPALSQRGREQEFLNKAQNGFYSLSLWEGLGLS